MQLNIDSKYQKKQYTSRENILFDALSVVYRYILNLKTVFWRKKKLT